MEEEEWKTLLLDNPTQLVKKPVQVWKNSSYYERLMHLQEEIGDTIYVEGFEREMYILLKFHKYTWCFMKSVWEGNSFG